MRSRALLSLCAFLTACGGDNGQDPTPPPDPLSVATVVPADAASDVAATGVVTATFNGDVIAASVTPQTFVLSAGGGGPLSTEVTYDPAARTARLSAPLLPATLYQAELTTGITGADGEPLAEPEVWSFTTRIMGAGKVDVAGAVGRRASLAIDAGGRLHVAYRDSTNLDLKYATCEEACASSANWITTAVDQDGSLAYSVSLAVAPDGELHVLYTDSDNFDLRYATCTADCTSQGAWTTATVDSVGNIGNFGSLGIDEDGRLHATYFVFSGPFHLRYATCTLSCAAPESWTTANIGPVGTGVFRASLAVDGAGRVHVAWPKHSGSGDLQYASCAAECNQDASWELGSVDFFTTTPSIVVEENGAVHLTYYSSIPDDLMYATCSIQCGTLANWVTVAVDQAGDVGAHSSLTRDADGRLQVVYYDATNGDLKYATCAAACTAAASWRRTALDQDGDVGTWTTSALGPDGGLHVLYHDETTADLDYIH